MCIFVKREWSGLPLVVSSVDIGLLQNYTLLYQEKLHYYIKNHITHYIKNHIWHILIETGPSPISGDGALKHKRSHNHKILPPSGGKIEDYLLYFCISFILYYNPKTIQNKTKKHYL